MTFLGIFLSTLVHLLLIVLLSLFSNNPLLNVSKKTISVHNENIVLHGTKYKKVEVTLGSLPTVAKKDIKFLNQVSSSVDKNTLIYPDKKKKIIEKLKLEEKDTTKKESKRPKYFKKLKELKAITSQLKKELQKQTEAGIGNTSPYLETIKQLIKVNWKLPAWLKEKKLKTVLSFFIKKDGVIDDVSINISSGNKDFDKIAINAVKEASPLPNPPISMLNTKIFVSFP